MGGALRFTAFSPRSLYHTALCAQLLAFPARRVRSVSRCSRQDCQSCSCVNRLHIGAHWRNHTPRGASRFPRHAMTSSCTFEQLAGIAKHDGWQMRSGRSEGQDTSPGSHRRRAIRQRPCYRSTPMWKVPRLAPQVTARRPYPQIHRWCRVPRRSPVPPATRHARHALRSCRPAARECCPHS